MRMCMERKAPSPYSMLQGSRITWLIIGRFEVSELDQKIANVAQNDSVISYFSSLFISGGWFEENGQSVVWAV